MWIPVLNTAIIGLAVIVNACITISFIELIQMFYTIRFDSVMPYLNMVGIYSIPKQYTAYIITGIVMATFVVASMTPIADYFLRHLYGFRQPLREENERLQTLFNEVCHTANKNPADYRLFIVDERVPNAYALGMNNIGIGRNLLMQLPDQEVKGVLAHELGHIHYGDSTFNRAFVTVNLIGQAILAIYGFITNVSLTLGRFIPFAAFITLPLWFAFSIQITIIQFFINLPLNIGAMIGARQKEYRADRYSVEIGYGNGLYNFLYRILDLSMESNNSILNLLKASHPKVGNRLLKLERIAQKEANQISAMTNVQP